MSIERDKWLYVYTDSAELARRFFGLPENTPVNPQREVDGRICWAVKAPEGADITALKAGPPPLEES